MNKSFYITTAISYVNGAPHIGHAYEAIAADVMARYKRLLGYDVYFLTGTDEHGQKVEKTAEKNGKSAREFCDEIAKLFEDMTEYLNISNDDFIRTTEERHIPATHGMWNKLSDNDDIYLDKYAGWYSVRDEAFYTESEIEKREDGQKVTIETQTEVEWVEEESYFFKLSNYTDKLLAYYEENPEFIQPKSRHNEIVSFVKGGLRDLSISRTTFDWGVSVPDNDKHIMYVWLDALTNYITALGYPETKGNLFEKFWPADVHLIGKDILRFHAVYWPAFLMSAGLEMPKTVFAHGFLNISGEKMSKSLGNVLHPQKLTEEYGLDQIRYFLLSGVSFGKDGDFSKDSLVEKINSDLANNLGNLIQRSMSMIYKNCDAKLPEIGELTDKDKELLDKARNVAPKQFQVHFDKMEFHKSLESVWRVISDANIYIDEQAPWTLKKTDEERMATVLYVVAETLRNIAILLQPVMPDSTSKILDLLEVPINIRSYKHIGKEFALRSQTVIQKPVGIFPRHIVMAAEIGEYNIIGGDANLKKEAKK